MNKAELALKLESLVKSYRERLEANDGSTINSIASGVKNLFSNFKNAMDEKDPARSGWNKIKELAGQLEKAVEDGDKALSAKVLDGMERAIQALKSKQA